MIAYIKTDYCVTLSGPSIPVKAFPSPPLLYVTAIQPLRRTERCFVLPSCSVTPRRIMSSPFCFAVLALFSLTAATDPNCEELIKPLDDRTKIYGKWLLYAGTSDCENTLTKLKTIKSSWIEIVAIPESEDITLYYGDIMDGICYRGSAISTFDGDVTKSTFYFNSSLHVHYGKHLVSCPDCLLWVDTNKAESQGCRSMYLYTKTGGLDEADQAQFKQQLACLNFNLDLFYGDTKDMCPYEKVDTVIVEKEEQ